MQLCTQTDIKKNLIKLHLFIVVMKEMGLIEVMSTYSESWFYTRAQQPLSP